MTNEIKEATATMDLLQKAKTVVDAVLAKMNELEVTSLGPVYIKNWHNQTHGTQTRLHLVGDEREADLVFVRHASNDDDDFYEFGDFNLPYTLPNLETVFEFLDSVDEINDAIDEINDKIKAAAEKNYTIK